MGAADNKTLRTRCGSCDKELVTFVDPDVSTRTTWPLVGEKDGRKHTYAVCSDCHKSGWHPPGFQS
jgi:uncharacterized protein with PIN domain